MSNFDHRAFEEFWRNKWDEARLYCTDTGSSKEKLYLLVEFPYPSGEGLHVGHVRSYTAMDVIARKKRREGFEVLFPIGFDAFGLPAENFAIKNGVHPAVTTRKNIDNFTKQMKNCGFSFDWDRSIETTDPLYYKWTQWIFLKMYEKGLAYKKEMPVNWCPKDKCVLANEEVIDGACERCGTPVEKKNKKQWMLAITKYAERLHKDLNETAYLEKIKIQQRNWIGLSEGSEIDFTLKAGDASHPFTVFTTRADTLFGCTYCVFAPEHPLVKELLEKGSIRNASEVENYIKEAVQKTDIDRSAEGKEKTGLILEGATAVNPVNNEEVPVFIADYVLPQYGTGAIMAVPAHDERDYQFAKKYAIPMRDVVLPKDAQAVEGLFVEDGILTNSGGYDGLASEDARKKITEAVRGRIVTKSKLRDWVFARQRYWGEPIPVVYDEAGKMYPVHESELPVTLPHLDTFEPTDNGESPLFKVPEWVNVTGRIDENGYFHTDANGAPFKRETDTMPQWAGSSWYFMRYIDPKNDSAIGDRVLLDKWLPVDWYNGGMEHTTLHLLYSRFWYKFLYDIGVVKNSEPYYKRTSQGMILGAGGVKMSKSLGNVVNPDDIIKEYGADVLRVYEMFVGPFDQSVAWDDRAIVGVERFLEKVEKLAAKVGDNAPSCPAVHQSAEKVTKDIEEMGFNTCVSQLMIAANELEKMSAIRKNEYEMLLQLLAPFAPFVTEELWKNLGHDTSIHASPWPQADATLLLEKNVTIAIQIGGKLRGTANFARDSSEETVLAEVKKLDIYQKYAGDDAPKKVVFVPNKLINIVI